MVHNLLFNDNIFLHRNVYWGINIYMCCVVFYRFLYWMFATAWVNEMCLSYFQTGSLEESMDKFTFSSMNMFCPRIYSLSGHQMCTAGKCRWPRRSLIMISFFILNDWFIDFLQHVHIWYKPLQLTQLAFRTTYLSVVLVFQTNLKNQCFTHEKLAFNNMVPFKPICYGR